MFSLGEPEIPLLLIRPRVFDDGEVRELCEAGASRWLGRSAADRSHCGSLVHTMSEVVIVSAVRTPVGKFQGSLQSFSAPQLGALVVREAVRRAGVEPARVDDCIMGCVLQAGLGQNPARQAAIFAGLPPEVGALTVNQVCGSGLRAVSLAAQAIQIGDAETVVAGGMESMTNAPYLLPTGQIGISHGQRTPLSMR